MALIVEDGSIVSGAESYCTAVYATAYHANRGNTSWAALSASEMEQALRKATDYMLQKYRSRWNGVRVDPPDQPLDWPRYGVVADGVGIDDDVVPAEVQKACAELALKAASGVLLEDLTRGVKREKVGTIEVEYDAYSPNGTRYPAIDAMLAPYLQSGGTSSVGLVRS